MPDSRTCSVISASNGRARVGASAPGRAKSTWMTEAPASLMPTSAFRRSSVASIQPFAGGFEIHVAVDPLGDAGAAEGRQTLIDAPPGLAELRIGAVAQRQHGEAGLFETRRVLGHQGFVEIDGALRRVALAPGGGDHQQVLGRSGLGGRDIGHVQHLRREAEPGGNLADLAGQRLGIARLGAEQDGQRRPFGRRCSRGGGRTGGGRLQPRQIAGQPGALLRRGDGDDAVQRGDLVLGERGGVGQQEGGWHGVSFSP